MSSRKTSLICIDPQNDFCIANGPGGEKGALVVPGADADIVFWDPEKCVDYGVKIAKQRTDYNVYEGMQLKGFPVKVLLRGKVIVDGEEWKGTHGGGQFLKCPPIGD